MQFLDPTNDYACKKALVDRDQGERDHYEAQWKANRDRSAEIEAGEDRGFGKGVRTVAENMLGLGLPFDTIAKASGLSLDDLKQLNGALKNESL